MRNKKDFEALLGMGYSAKEALALLPEDGKKEEAPAPQPEVPAEKPEVKKEAEQKQEEKKEQKKDDSSEFVSSMNASMTNIMSALDKLTKAIQASNRVSVSTNEDPDIKKADEFIANLFKKGE